MVGERNKKIGLKLLAITPLLVIIFFIFLIFQLKWYAMGSGVLWRSYFYGLGIFINSIFITFMVYFIINVKLPKIENSKLSHFFSAFIFIYFVVYVILGEMIWGFLTNTLVRINPDLPETITNVLMIISLVFIFFYRVLLYLENLSLPVNKDLFNLFNTYIPLRVMNPKHIRDLLGGFLFSAIFIANLILFISNGLLPENYANLLPIGLSRAFLFGAIFLLLEVLLWALVVQYKDEIKKEFEDKKRVHRIQKPLPIKKNKTWEKIKKLKFYKKLSKVMHILFRTRYRYATIPILILLFVFVLYWDFTHQPKYSEKEVEVNAYLLKMDFSKEPKYPLAYIEPKSRQVSNFSYTLIEKSDGRKTLLTQTDKDRHDNRILDYRVMGYVNIRNEKVKSLYNYVVALNSSQKRLLKELDSTTKDYGEFEADSDIFAVLFDSNITQICSIFIVHTTNYLDPSYLLLKIYMFKNKGLTEVIQYSGEFHVVPENQEIILFSHDKDLINNFKNSKQLNINIANESSRTSHWNETKAYNYCFNNQ